MRVIFWQSGKSYEPYVVPVFAEGVKRHGDTIDIRSMANYQHPEGEVGVVLGITKTTVIWSHHKHRHPILRLDKGYIRSRAPWLGGSPPKWWRVSLNSTHPTWYFQNTPRPSDRWEMTGISLAERKEDGHNIVIAGSSAKYHYCNRLPEPTVWAEKIIRHIQHLTDRPIIYRPKPSWGDARAVDGAAFDYVGRKEPFSDRLVDAYCVITHGSMACVEAIVAGVPCIVLGDAIARPISSTSLDDINDLKWVERKIRKQWANDLGYCQWTLSEFQDGTAWAVIKEQIQDAYAHA